MLRSTAARALGAAGMRPLAETALLILLTLTLGSHAMAQDRSMQDASEEVEGDAGDHAYGDSQDDAGTTGENGLQQGLEDIVISAERRTRNLQDTAAAVSAFTTTDLTQRGITDFSTLQYNVPGLFSGGGLTKITLRGVGSEIVGPGVDPGFAVHVNGVFSARETTGLLDYFDVQSVEILRGPQGILWGRNSTGGAVNMITARPEYDFDFNGDVEIGQFENNATGVRIRGMVNMPLVEDKLALRVAGLAYMQDGLMEISSVDGHYQRVGDAGTLTLRPTLRFEPTESLTMDLIGSFFRSKGAGPAQKFDGDYFTPPRNPGTPGVSDTFENWPGAGPGANFDGALPNPESPFEGTANEPQRLDAKVWTATLIVDWLADGFELKSITGYQHTSFQLHRDQDTSSLDISTLDLWDKSMQASQEFLINSTWDIPINYTVGTNYQYDRTPRTQALITDPQSELESVDWQLLPSLGPIPGIVEPPGLSLVDGCPPPPTILGPFDPACPPIKEAGEVREVVTNAKAEARNHVFGLFGNVEWEVIEELRFAVGGRFSYTHRTWIDETFATTYAPIANINGNNVGLQVLQNGVAQQEDWLYGTWRVRVDYRPNEDHMLYASVTTGARAGGFNFNQEEPFGGEEILTYEAGSRSTFFDSRLTLNLTGFYNDWENPQIGGTENALPIVRNAPAARSYGIEVEWRARPIDELQLNGSFGWLEANYIGEVETDNGFRDCTERDFSDSNPLSQCLLVGLDGNRMPRSPRFTVSAGAMYTFDFGSWGLLAPRADVYYRDDITFRQYNNPKDVQPSYVRLDARIMWFSESGRYWMEIYGRNLTNEYIRTNQEIQNGIYRKYYYDSPINGGMRFGYSFK